MRLVLVLPALAACASVSPRFEQAVASSFAQEDMRRLTTADVELYYPAAYAEQAQRVAARASECLRELRSLERTRRDHGRALLFLTSANFNNAYVGGQALGEPLHSLNPLTATWELFNWYDLDPSDTGDIACHEMFHYAHFEQIEGFWRFFNLTFGPLVSSQVFLERWFTEGVAQYYEGRLHRRAGRPHSPLYRGAFDAFVAERGGRLGGGDLSLYQRELLPASGAYLTGLFFVEWLVETYGEDKLWELMELQGRSFFSPFGATLRFRSVYGASAGALLDRWSRHLTDGLRVRTRPPEQRVLREDLGLLARLATHPASGRVAVVSQGLEEVPMLRTLSRDGVVLAQRRLLRMKPDREWVLAGPSTMSGLAFSEDGRFLFVLNDDLTERGDQRAQLWKLDAATLEVLEVHSDLGRAMGGSVSADGQRYTMIELPPTGAARVVERELASGRARVVFQAPPGVGLGAPAWSPSQTRLALAVRDGHGWNLALVEADGALRRLTSDGAFNYAPRWADENHLVFARRSGPYLQAHRLDVESGRLERLTDAPYGVMDPSPVGGGVMVLNRDGTHWSLDFAPDAAKETVREGPGEAEPAPEELARHEPEPLVVQDDRPYSPLDHLFIPQLRAPAALLGLDTDDAGRTTLVTSLFASLSGRDRLGFHNWGVEAQLDLPKLTSYISVAYRNLQLAPWSVTARASREGLTDVAYWSGALSVDRIFFTVPLSLGARAELAQTASAGTRRYLGPFFSFSWGATESTPYGGIQRHLALSADVAGYPRALGSTRDLLDLRLGFAGAVPLPISKRHSLVMSLTGRVLPGAPEGTLRIGGVSRGVSILSETRTSPAGPKVFVPPGLVEGVRGFDDHVVRATGAAIASARYRYAFIVDRGFLSTLYLFPSLFVRQVDAELFGSAALTNNPSATWARAAGAAVFLRLVLGGWIPASIYYQFAWRFDFGLSPLHVVGFAME